MRRPPSDRAFNSQTPSPPAPSAAGSSSAASGRTAPSNSAPHRLIAQRLSQHRATGSLRLSSKTSRPSYQAPSGRNLQMPSPAAACPSTCIAATNFLAILPSMPQPSRGPTAQLAQYPARGLKPQQPRTRRDSSRRSFQCVFAACSAPAANTLVRCERRAPVRPKPHGQSDKSVAFSQLFVSALCVRETSRVSLRISDWCCGAGGASVVRVVSVVLGLCLAAHC